ncbi:MAG TPA: class I SAM-dependent methyltransferase [Steroidobacteraceae bacterium]
MTMGKCVSCGGCLKRVRKYNFKSDAFRKVYSDRHVYSCVDCGLSQTDVSKINEDALTGYYRAEYRAVAHIGVGDPGHRWYRARATALALLAAEHLARSPGRVFELGAGYGYNLLAVKELYPAALLFTDELDETVTLPDAINRAELSGGSYDVVILSHVLEHFTDPKSLIRSALKALAVGGIVVIEVPNDVPGIFPLNGPDEPHLTFFTAQTLTALLGSPAVFGAGPRYQRKTIYMRGRRFASRIVRRIPYLSKLVESRQVRVVSPESFSVRRSDGVFLRAVLGRRAE